MMLLVQIVFPGIVGWLVRVGRAVAVQATHNRVPVDLIEVHP